MLIATLHATLPAGADGIAPEWVHLIPAGIFRGQDGRGPYHLRDAAGVIAASMDQAIGGQMPIDENHATDHAMRTGQESPARGWIVELQSRGDGIWGRVEWTQAGKALMAERAYRGFSPVFTHDKSGNVLAILRAAMTNTPNLTQLATIQTQGQSMEILPQLRTALGLPEAADEAAILAATTSLCTRAAAHAAQLRGIATAAGIAAAEAATPDGIVVALNAMRAQGVSPETVVALQTELNTLRAEIGREKAVAIIDGAIKAGKPINALRDHYIARHVQDAKAVETEIGAMVSINAGGMRQTRHAAGGEPDGDELTTDDMSVIQKMGLDPKKFAEQKKKQREAAEGSMA